MNQDIKSLFDLLEQLVEAVQEEDPLRRKRKLETVKEKVHRGKPSLVKEIS